MINVSTLFVSSNRRCPPGHMVKANSTGKFCVYTLCASRPCHRGTCVAQSPSKFTCQCPEGYRGRHCEVTLAIYRDDVGLSFSSLFAICICFMALLGTYLQHVLLKSHHSLTLMSLQLAIWVIILIIIIIQVLKWCCYIDKCELLH